MGLADLINDGSFAVRFKCPACFDTGKTWEDDGLTTGGSVSVPCHACRCEDCGRESDHGERCADCERMARGDDGRAVC